MTEQVYGHDKTYHQSQTVDVELDPDGNVCGVWFRCATLPFTQRRVDETRAAEMRTGKPKPLIAVVFEQD